MYGYTYIICIEKFHNYFGVVPAFRENSNIIKVGVPEEHFGYNVISVENVRKHDEIIFEH